MFQYLAYVSVFCVAVIVMISLAGIISMAIDALMGFLFDEEHMEWIWDNEQKVLKKHHQRKDMQ